MQQTILHVAQNVFSDEADSLKNAFSSISPSVFLFVVDALKNAERIAASGCGHSGIACRHFVHLMCCIERPARFISPSEGLHGALGYLQAGDVMLLASRGGETTELLAMLDVCKKRNVFVIAITENMDTLFAKEANLALGMKFGLEVDRYHSQGTTSFTVLSVLFDALQCALIEETDFQQERFASVHPGGAVGARLNR